MASDPLEGVQFLARKRGGDHFNRPRSQSHIVSSVPIAVNAKHTVGQNRMGLALDAKQNLVIYLAYNQAQ